MNLIETFTLKNSKIKSLRDAMSGIMGKRGFSGEIDYMLATTYKALDDAVKVAEGQVVALGEEPDASAVTAIWKQSQQVSVYRLTPAQWPAKARTIDLFNNLFLIKAE